MVGVVSLRFAGPIFFANVAALQARIRAALQDRPETQAIILDLTATADIDLTAADAIRGLEADLAARWPPLGRGQTARARSG